MDVNKLLKALDDTSNEGLLNFTTEKRWRYSSPRMGTNTTWRLEAASQSARTYQELPIFGSHSNISMALWL